MFNLGTPDCLRVYVKGWSRWEFVGRHPFEEDDDGKAMRQAKGLEAKGNRVRVKLFLKKTKERVVWYESTAKNRRTRYPA